MKTSGVEAELYYLVAMVLKEWDNILPGHLTSEHFYTDRESEFFFGELLGRLYKNIQTSHLAQDRA